MANYKVCFGTWAWENDVLGWQTTARQPSRHMSLSVRQHLFEIFHQIFNLTK